MKDKEKFLMDIPAEDKEGKIYTKHVHILYRDYKGSMGRIYGNCVIDFGWPCSYFLRTLLKDYPFTKSLCIDMEGRNHNGSAVCISAGNMNKVLEKARPSIIYTPRFLLHRELKLLGYRISW